MIDERDEHRIIIEAEKGTGTGAIAMYRELAEHRRKQGGKIAVLVVEDLCTRLERAIKMIGRQALITNQAAAALKLAYRKHHLGDDSVGSNELSDDLCNALCEIIGDKAFQRWVADTTGGKDE